MHRETIRPMYDLDAHPAASDWLVMKSIDGGTLSAGEVRPAKCDQRNAASEVRPAMCGRRARPE